MTVLNDAASLRLGSQTVARAMLGVNQVWPGPGVVNWALVNQSSVAGNPSTSPITPAIDTTGANFLVAIGCCSGNPGVLADNRGNTYSPAYVSVAFNSGIRAMYCRTTNVGPGHLISWNVAFGPLFFLAFSGAPTTVEVAEMHANDASAPSAVAVGPFTIVKNNTLLVTAFCAPANAPYSLLPGAFTKVATQNYNISSSLGGGVGYLIYPSGGPLTSANWVFGGSSSADGTVVLLRIQPGT